MMRRRAAASAWLSTLALVVACDPEDAVAPAHDAATPRTQPDANPARADAGPHVEPPDAGPPPENVCVSTEGCPTGVWMDVTPTGVDPLVDFGAKYVVNDPQHPERFFTMFTSQGVWRSDDYAQTWRLVSTGTLGEDINGCAGGISIPHSDTSDPPTLYAACIRGAVGFYRSHNGGVDWERFTVGASSDQQFNYRPVIDPYDADHLLMTGHGNPLLVESTDGGETWTEIVTLDAMRANGLGGGTGDLAFVDTGDPATTRDRWLWLAAQSDANGTWLTTTGGRAQAWVQVERNEHVNGSFQLYQPDAQGVVDMAGVYSHQGWGVFRSEDYGETWTHVGANAPEAIVFGTAKNVYAMYGWAIGSGGVTDPTLQVAAQPATAEWTMPGTPAEMTQGPASAAVSHDGEHAIIVIAAYNAGLWRYIEP